MEGFAFSANGRAPGWRGRVMLPLSNFQSDLGYFCEPFVPFLVLSGLRTSVGGPGKRVCFCLVRMRADLHASGICKLHLCSETAWQMTEGPPHCVRLHLCEPSWHQLPDTWVKKSSGRPDPSHHLTALSWATPKPDHTAKLFSNFQSMETERQ